MEFGQAISSGFKKYAVFSGVATRSEFWFWILFTQLVNVAISIFQSALLPLGQGSLTSDGNLVNSSLWALGSAASGLSGLWSLAVFLPTLAVSARRLRDMGKSPQWLWLYLAPMGSAVVALIGWLLPLRSGSNNFCFIDNCSDYSGWIGVGFTLIAILLVALGVAVLFLIWFVQPTLTVEQGNKYVQTQPVVAPAVPPIDPGTTA